MTYPMSYMTASPESRFQRPFLLALGWTLLIFAAISLPSSNLPSSQLFEYDKVAHLVLFGGYGLSWMIALRGTFLRRTLWTFLTGAVYAAATEWYQAAVLSGRQGDPYDALADLAGLAVGIAVALLWMRWRRRPASASA